MRHQPIAPALQTAANVGGFATDRQLTAENLRAAQFADEQQRALAQIQLSASAQGFGQQQANRDFDFRQQQADYQRGAQQEGFDIQRDQIGAGLERARIGAQADLAQTDLRGQQQYDLADLQGQYGLQRVGQQQAGADSRAADANDLRLVLAGMNIDSRTATAQERQMGMERLAAIRGQQQSDQAAANFGYRGALQDDQQQFQQGQQQRSFENQGVLQGQRLQASGQNAGYQDWTANRLYLSTQMQRAQDTIGLLNRQAQTKDRAGRPTPEAVKAANQIPALMQTLQDMQQQFGQLGPPPSRQAPLYPAGGGIGGNIGQPSFTDIDPAIEQQIYQQYGAQPVAQPPQSAPPAVVLPDGRRFTLVGIGPDGQPHYAPAQ